MVNECVGVTFDLRRQDQAVITCTKLEWDFIMGAGGYNPNKCVKIETLEVGWPLLGPEKNFNIYKIYLIPQICKIYQIYLKENIQYNKCI